jgi:WD40 repeat protein
MIVLKTKRQKIERVVFAGRVMGLAAVGRSGAFFWPSLTTEGKQLQADTWDIGTDPTGDYAVVSSQTTATLHRLIDGPASQFHNLHSAIWVSASPTEPLFVLSTLTSAPMQGWRIGIEGSIVRAWSVTPAGPTSCPVFAPDGSWVVHCEFQGWHLGGHPYRLVFRRSEDGEMTRTITFPDFIPGRPTISPHGLWIAFILGEHFCVRELCDQALLVHREKTNTLKHFTGIAFHPSGRFLAATSNDKTVKLYDTTTWEIARTFTWDIGKMRSIAFSPDGTLAAAGSDTGKVVVWDVDV